MRFREGDIVINKERESDGELEVYNVGDKLVACKYPDRITTFLPLDSLEIVKYNFRIGDYVLRDLDSNVMVVTGIDSETGHVKCREQKDNAEEYMLDPHFLIRLSKLEKQERTTGFKEGDTVTLSDYPYEPCKIKEIFLNGTCKLSWEDRSGGIYSLEDIRHVEKSEHVLSTCDELTQKLKEVSDSYMCKEVGDGGLSFYEVIGCIELLKLNLHKYQLTIAERK